LAAFLAVVLAFPAFPAGAPTFHEPWRPQFHFTAPDTWMNDPNGMVWYDGEYHLFYQNNPFGDKWGHMSWGHAVSRDLAHWEHLPLALAEENGVMIFSGSAVVDWRNTSGFGKDGRPPMVALYTGHHTGKPLQNQQLAYSNDRGRTWTKFAGNPVLDIGEADFRDPKVFWHEATRRWVMAVSWPVHRQVRFYASPDLKSWTHLSDFGPAGSTTGIWECPDLFPLKVEGFGRGSKWVLVVNVGSGAPAGGSGTQYFVGEFDGTRFVADARSATNWADFGPDFYAAVSWSDVPKRDGRRLWLGWMSNWAYANDVPTSPWRSAMTVPRELTLRATTSGYRLVQRPVRELAALRGAPARIGRTGIDAAQAWLSTRRFEEGLAELELELDRLPSSGEVSLRLLHGEAGETRIDLDLGGRFLRFNRGRSGRKDFNAAFADAQTAPVRIVDGKASLRLLVDVSSVEVLAQDCETVMTDLVFPKSTRLGFSLSADHLAQAARVRKLTVWPLKAAPPTGPAAVSR